MNEPKYDLTARSTSALVCITVRQSVWPDFDMEEVIQGRVEVACAVNWARAERWGTCRVTGTCAKSRTRLFRFAPSCGSEQGFSDSDANPPCAPADQTINPMFFAAS